MLTLYVDTGLFQAVLIGLLVAMGKGIIDDIDEQVDDFVETGTPIEFEGICSILAQPLLDKPAKKFHLGIAVIPPGCHPTEMEMEVAAIHLATVTGRISRRSEDGRTICFREDCLPHQIPRMPTPEEILGGRNSPPDPDLLKRCMHDDTVKGGNIVLDRVGIPLPKT